MNTICPSCKGPWSISKGPGRVVGAIARDIMGVYAPLPDDFEFEYCKPCQKRNLTPELEARFFEVEKEYLTRPKPPEPKKEVPKLTYSSDWVIKGSGPDSIAEQGEGLAHIKPFNNHEEDFTSIECHDGVIIPDEVLAEMLRRKGWKVARG
jgi:hypothetical protein